jgi:hypothetical protein
MYLSKFDIGFLHILHRLIDVVVYAIKEGTLIYYELVEGFKHLGQTIDHLNELIDISLTTLSINGYRSYITSSYFSCSAWVRDDPESISLSF